MRSFLWFVCFPALPWLLALGAAWGCADAGVGVAWAWLVIGLCVPCAFAAAWYGQRKGRDLISRGKL